MTGNSRTPAARLLTIGGLIAAGERPLRTSAGRLVHRRTSTSEVVSLSGWARVIDLAMPAGFSSTA